MSRYDLGAQVHYHAGVQFDPCSTSVSLHELGVRTGGSVETTDLLTTCRGMGLKEPLGGSVRRHIDRRSVARISLGSIGVPQRVRLPTHRRCRSAWESTVGFLADGREPELG